MAGRDGRPQTVEIEKFRRRIDFHRSIHRNLNDGALLALCEDYGDPEAEDPPPEA